MERIIHLCFLIAVTVIAGMCLLLYDALARTQEGSSRLHQLNNVFDTVHQVRDDYIRAESAARQYAGSGNPANLAENARLLKKIQADIAALPLLLEGDSDQQARLQQLTAAFAKPNPMLDAALPIRQGEHYGIALMQVRQEFFDAVSGISNNNLRSLEELSEAAQHRFRTTLVRLVSLVCIGLLVLAAVYLTVLEHFRVRRRAELKEKESSSLLRLTVDSVDGMIVYIGRDQRYQFHNKAYAQMFGRDSEPIVGATVAQVLKPEEFRQTQGWIEQVLAGTAVQGERRHEMADGRGKDLRVHFVPHRAESGQVQGFFGQITDITEFRRKEALLLATTTFQQAILDSAHISIITTDRDGIIRSFNIGAERKLGYRADELVGRFTPACFHDERECREYAEALSQELGEPVGPGPEIFMARVRRGQIEEREWTYIRKDGSRLPVFLSITTLRTEQDGIIGYLGMAFDITPQKETEAQLEQARVEAEAASRAKSAFLATMSHEIRTPMNGVLGMAEVLARSRLAAHQADMVQTIRESAGVLLNLIDDILDFSKIEAGRLELEQAPLSIRELAEGICTSLLPVAARKEVELYLFIAPDIPECVLADDVRLRQILYNLLGNAIKFSGGRPDQRGRVWLRAEVSKAQPLNVVFRIIDNGIGMAPETLDKLFTAFTQGEISTTRRFGGSGLGLAICKRVVDLMQGNIAVDSAPGIGTTFTVTLPFRRAPEQARQELPDLSGLDCILIDNPLIAAADLGAYLAPQGAQIGVAASLDGAAAMAAASLRCAPVVVVYDAGNHPAAHQVLRDAFHDAPHVRPLLLTRGSRRQARIEAPDLVSLDADAMPRRSFLRAVAVAAGRASPETLQDQASPQPMMEITPPSIAQARAQGRLLLVAEDDAINQKVILRQLGLLGYAAEIAGTGAQALQLWRAGRYALLLTDLHMPELDGYGLATAIRAEEPPERRMPILALTANALRGESSRALACGMEGYLTKPVRLDLLQQALEKWMPPDSPAANGTRALIGGAALPVEPAVDVSVLKALVGADEEAVFELLTDFQEAVRQQAAQLRQALAAGDAGLAGAVAHMLKSSSRSVGALALGDACAELENAGKAADQASTLHSMAKFEAAFAAVEDTLAGLLAERQ
jgi:PAS domain S-box-containing protein